MKERWEPDRCACIESKKGDVMEESAIGGLLVANGNSLSVRCGEKMPLQYSRLRATWWEREGASERWKHETVRLAASTLVMGAGNM